MSALDAVAKNRQKIRHGALGSLDTLRLIVEKESTGKKVEKVWA